MHIRSKTSTHYTPLYNSIAAAAATTINRPLPTTFSAPLTVTGLVVDAGAEPELVGLVVTTSTGGTVTEPLGLALLPPIELGATEGAKLPLVADSVSLPLPVGWAPPPVTVVDVRRVLATGQTVVPMGTRLVVSRAGQLVVTDGGHDVMVYQCVE